MQMQMNIKCSVSGCVSPVIGQCPGYNTDCGRYYCETHTDGRFCLNCAQDVKSHEIYEDYLTTAKALPGKAFTLQEQVLFGLKGGAIGMAIAIAPFCLLPFIIFFQQSTELSVFALAFSVVSVVWSCLSFMVVLTIMAILNHQYANKRINAKVAEINESKPGFARFYEAWEAERNKAALATSLGIAAAIAGAMVLAPIQDTLERDRISRAVDESLKRHGY